jgi:two-component system response regulator FixJ
MPTVFLVDDDEALRDALSQHLESAGLEVEAYADGSAFLAACTDDRPGCVVLDIAMPGMDGREVHAALKARGSPIPIVFLTGHGDVPMAVEAVQNGALDFLEKPIRGPVLVERVRRALALDEERRRARRETHRIRERYAHLSRREREVMALVVEGWSNKHIARKLDLSPRTVEHHRARAMCKMEASNLAELVRMAAWCCD